MGIISIVIIIAIVILIVVLYNSVIAKKNAVTNAFGTIDAMLKKRHDLIPNLVETVKQYMNYERDTLTKVTEMRTRAMDVSTPANEKMALENQIGSTLRGLMVQVENYPDLKANQNFLQLQQSWNEIEEQLSAARRTYNATVTEYNNALEQFPTSVFGRMMHLEVKPVLEIPDEERANISAKDLFKS